MKEQVSIRLPEDLLKKIDESANDSKNNRSQEIKDLIEEALDNRKQASLIDIDEKMTHIEEMLDYFYPVMVLFHERLGIEKRIKNILNEEQEGSMPFKYFLIAMAILLVLIFALLGHILIVVWAASI